MKELVLDVLAKTMNPTGSKNKVSFRQFKFLNQVITSKLLGMNFGKIDGLCSNLFLYDCTPTIGNRSRNFYLEHTCPKSLPLNVASDARLSPCSLSLSLKLLFPPATL
jgi:hypothetical protein